MTQEEKGQRKTTKQLKEAQEKHQLLLAKIEKTRAKLDRRTRKLQRLEAKIVHLEQLAAQPDKAKLGQAAVGKDQLRRARLIFNPESGDGTDNAKRLVEIVGRLREHGILAGIGLKTSGKAARELAKEAVENGEDLVIVAGGDGTIEDVASQLVDSSVTLGLLPTGTMNNLARSLGVPLDLDDACALLGAGLTRQIDIGRVVTNEKPNVEYFLEGAGAGLSAIVLPAGHALEKGRWATLPMTIRKLFDSKPAPIEVELDDHPAIHAYSQIVTVSNSPMMGKNIMVAPDAKMDDGLLDVAIYDGMTKTELLQHFLAASNGTRVDNPKIRYYRARKIRISTNQELDANSDKDLIDGDRILENSGTASLVPAPSPSEAPPAENGQKQREYVLEIEVKPRALNMVVGKGIALSLPVEAVPSVPPLSGPQPEPAQVGGGGNGAVQQTL